MHLKIYCPCGTKFAFDVEPSNGRMPVPVACPSCGQDATSLANEQIQAQSPSAPEVSEVQPRPAGSKPAGRMHVALPHAAPPQPKPSRPPLAVRIDSQPPTDEPSAPHPTCPKHVGQPAVESCRVCGKPICRKCMAMFGYVCSVYCRNKAEAEGLELPVYAQQRSVIQRKTRTRTRVLVIAAACALVLLSVVGIYYKAYASKPHVVHTLALATGGFDSGTYELLDNDTYLTIAEGKVALHGLVSGEPLWTVSLDRDNGSPGDGFGFETLERLLDQEHGLWIQSGNRVLCYERDTGTLRHEVKLEGYLEDCISDGSFITLVSFTGGMSGEPSRTITRITLADGKVTSLQLPPAEKASGSGARSGADAAEAHSDAVKPMFIAAGPNVAELRVQLLESRIIQHEAIKKPQQSILDSGAVSGANAMQAAEELINEMVQTHEGGIEYEDASRYQVTLRRHMQEDASEWTAEVVGRVGLFPMPTVDLLVAGKSLRVFDKQNNLLWEAALTYPIHESFYDVFDERKAPALESESTLYFFDRGMLTAFDLATGDPRWRIPSVGIWQVQQDHQGMLYVCSSSAGAEDLQYSKQVKVIDALQPVLMKVDPATGAVLWKSTRVGENCFLTGDYVYATKSTIDLTIALNPEDESTHFRVIRINPRTGTRLWTYYQPQEALEVDFSENIILLHFPDQIQVLKYLSL